MSGTRFAFYGRLSTTDRQDVSLARPTQFDACQRKVELLGGMITAKWFDEESGSRANRPGIQALLQEARDKDMRRFDAVICYQPSRLSRVMIDALIFERDLDKLGVSIEYAEGGHSKLERHIRMSLAEDMLVEFEKGNPACHAPERPRRLPQRWPRTLWLQAGARAALQ
jgi:DNA invertase Pin-like site-specific DNA recombinase